MKTSLLLIHPTLPERKLRHGFNWGALLLSTLWAFSEGLIPQAGRLFALDMGIKLLCTFDSQLTWALAFLLTLGKAIYCGRRGNGWLSKKWMSQGYHPG
ncbi:hypothetical protein Herbaro_11335 [Herbaspirillum sp. WKF16]|uniref:hypothetical protein n=1 Tax=Herbaspirillum sp. WKF16 TaxID=3028312 RepID=UPI0023A9B4CE|nr:hypothetical protein [Herbaspirillum sp. WKF16]WDZ98352.1 hypothetical protein Herbaro_11335 [Herbaspirillum sp. WKF16]